jgi:hypothetical protein
MKDLKFHLNFPLFLKVEILNFKTHFKIVRLQRHFYTDFKNFYTRGQSKKMREMSKNKSLFSYVITELTFSFFATLIEKLGRKNFEY